MAERILAVCEGDAGAIHHRAAAAAGLAQKFAIEAKGEADILVVGAAPPPPGCWARAWRLEDNSSGALDAAARLIAEGDYALVAFGDTPLLRELAGRLAVRLDLPVVASVLALRRRDGALVASRPAMSGTRTANFAIRRFPALLVVNPDATEAPSATSPAVEVQSLTMLGGPSPFALLQEERLSPREMEVTEADVVVAGGRGVGGKEGFDQLTELAAVLGGSVGASRVAVDLGWVPYARQVGLTGKSVSPRLYIACGISGAIHHTLGMRESSFIVAINSDARAPIFKIANVSIVGDLNEVIPALIADLRARAPGAERLAAVAGARG
jgi:electron transfer flavoprotein alpha subunit